MMTILPFQISSNPERSSMDFIFLLRLLTGKISINMEKAYDKLRDVIWCLLKMKDVLNV